MNEMKNSTLGIATMMALLLLVGASVAPMQLGMATPRGVVEMEESTIIENWANLMLGEDHESVRYPIDMEPGPAGSTYVTSTLTGVPTGDGDRLEKIDSTGVVRWTLSEPKTGILDTSAFTRTDGRDYLAITGYHLRNSGNHDVFGCGSETYSGGYEEGDGFGYLVLVIMEDVGDGLLCRAHLSYTELDGDVKPMKIGVDDEGQVVIFGSFIGTLNNPVQSRTTSGESPFVAMLSPWDGLSSTLSLENILTSEFSGLSSGHIHPISDFSRTGEQWSIGLNVARFPAGSWDVSQTGPEVVFEPQRTGPVILTADLRNWNWQLIGLAYDALEVEGISILTESAPTVDWIEGSSSFFMSVLINASTSNTSSLSMCNAIDPNPFDSGQYIIKSDLNQGGPTCTDFIRIDNGSVKDSTLYSFGGFAGIEDGLLVKVVSLGDSVTSATSPVNGETTLGVSQPSTDISFIRFDSDLEVHSFDLLIDDLSLMIDSEEFDGSLVNGMTQTESGISFFALTTLTQFEWGGTTVSSNCITCEEFTGWIGHFDWDTDSDDVPDSSDICPEVSDPNQINTDGMDDGGDACDDDDDDDSWDDTSEEDCGTDPLDPSSTPIDADGNGTCDALDPDAEPIPGCTYAGAENFNSTATIDDGSCTFPICEVCPEDEVEPDEDGDGIADSQDECSGTPTGSYVDDKGCEETKEAEGLGQLTDCDIQNRTNCGAEAVIVGTIGIGVIGGSSITRFLRPKGKGGRPKFDLRSAGDAKDAYDFIADRKPDKKGKKTGGSDHYFKQGVERQDAMSTSADTLLDDYIEDEP